ncbi:MAG: RNA polymerase sigma factor [Nitrospira sp.]|nr:RNA polymerase sigma factor [Nitrospira sp.]
MLEADSPHKTVVAIHDATRDLIAGLQKRDPNAQAQLYEQYGAQIHRYAARRLGDTELAQDLLVQVMVEANRNITRFNPRISTLRAWLFGIAHRQITDELRQRSRRKTPPASSQVSLEGVAEQRGPGDMAATTIARLEAQQQVARIQAQLSDSEMEVLRLRCVQQFSLTEIARTIGRSERAVNSLLVRAKQKAREVLSQEEDQNER